MRMITGRLLLLAGLVGICGEWHDDVRCILEWFEVYSFMVPFVLYVCVCKI